jgi:hypothetical protein
MPQPHPRRVRCRGNINIPELLLSNLDPVVHVYFLVDCLHSISKDCVHRWNMDMHKKGAILNFHHGIFEVGHWSLCLFLRSYSNPNSDGCRMTIGIGNREIMIVIHSTRHSDSNSHWQLGCKPGA